VKGFPGDEVEKNISDLEEEEPPRGECNSVPCREESEGKKMGGVQIGKNRDH
jgi:hypothetical protein